MSSLEENKALVTAYFDAIRASDIGKSVSMMADDLKFWCAGGTGASESVVFRSPDQLKIDIEHSIGDLYDPDPGIQPSILTMTAEEDRVVAEVRIEGRSAVSGATYDNLYVFSFWIRDGKFCEVHEHLDTLYATRVLLEPAGIESGADMPWLESTEG